MLASQFDFRQDVLDAVDKSLNLGMDIWRRFLSKSQHWPYETRRELQLYLLRGLSQEFDLGIESWDDYKSRKPSIKSDLREITPHNQEFGNPYQTSGSSGIPFQFFRDKSLEAIDSAIFERAWSWVGRKNELVLRLVSGNPKWKFYDYFRNIVPMNYRTIDESYVRWVMEKRPFLIHGVAGAIRDLSERIIAAGGKNSLRDTRLYLLSEDTRSHRQALAPYYAGVYMGYGNAECRTTASQCAFGTLHVNMETTIAESIDGEIYVTNLWNKVMPFVKYKTGDKGEVVYGKECRCGITSDAIEGIEGKVIDYYFGEGMKRPTGWWLVSPISHQYGDLVSAWRLEIVPSKRLIRIYAVPKSPDPEGKFNGYLAWLKENTGLQAELIKTDNLPDWRRKLLRVVDN
jgi:hypothetical protein